MGHFAIANQIVIIFSSCPASKAIPIVSIVSYHPNYPIFKVKMKKNYRFIIKNFTTKSNTLSQFYIKARHRNFILYRD